MIKRIFTGFLFFALFSICGNVFWFYSTGEFSLKNLKPPIQLSHPPSSHSLPPGPYQYLGHGKQSMVFENPDKTHVLKLFYWKRPLRKRWYRKVENWLRFASPAWILKTVKKKKELRELFTRYLWAFEDLPEETAIVQVHFCNSASPLWISLIDREGKTHEINLADYPFVVQKKIQLIPEYLNAKIEAKDLLGAKNGILLLREYFEKRIGMGYIDNPEVFAKNYGFLDGRAVQIDVGKFEKQTQFDVKKEKEKVFRNLQRYLEKHYPQLR